jgi:hypothetical protein
MQAEFAGRPKQLGAACCRNEAASLLSTVYAEPVHKFFRLSGTALLVLALVFGAVFLFALLF